VRWLVIPLAMFSAAAHSLAFAQAASLPTPVRDSAERADLAEQLETHSRIRIRLQSDQPDLVLLGPRLAEGAIRFERYAPGAWTLDTATGPHAIPLAAITRVQVRGSAWDIGAIVGFLVGAAAIEAVNAAGKYRIDRGESLFVGLLFGTAGAFVGGPIGVLFHKWKTVYGAP
jgi:hypothetical protein